MMLADQNLKMIIYNRNTWRLFFVAFYRTLNPHTYAGLGKSEHVKYYYLKRVIEMNILIPIHTYVNMIERVSRTIMSKWVHAQREGERNKFRTLIYSKMNRRNGLENQITRKIKHPN